MKNRICLELDISSELTRLNLSKEKLDLVISEAGERPSLYKIVMMFYKYGIYEGLDYLYDHYDSTLLQINFMESIFKYLASLADETKINYFYKKNKASIDEIPNWDKFYKYKENLTRNSLIDYADPYYTPIFDEGLKTLCTKKKMHILKNLYSKGFKPSLAQLKVATRTLNEEVFFTVFEEMNRYIVDDYIPILVSELCYYSKIEPIKFLFERLGPKNITQDILDKCLINSVNGNSKYSKLEIFEYMLSLGADITYNNYEVFEKIYGYGHSEILEFLYEKYNTFEHDENYNIKKYTDIAIEYNKVNIIEYLINDDKYKNNKYDLSKDKELVIKYSKEFNKHKESLICIIDNFFTNDKEFIVELKSVYKRQRKLQEYIKTLNI